MQSSEVWLRLAPSCEKHRPKGSTWQLGRPVVNAFAQMGGRVLT
jgi:hypothetical protein